MREIATNSECIIRAGELQARNSRKLFDTGATRSLEAAACSRNLAPSLMEKAGVEVARLLLAVAPHAKTIWIPCGPGNNGGDGLTAALFLMQKGMAVTVTLLDPTSASPPDASGALKRAQDAGVQFEAQPPAEFDACIDAIFGIGPLRSFNDRCRNWIGHINRSNAPVVSVDIPSGLNANSGSSAEPCVKARATLTLLTLKPGLFTAFGRDACGDIWFNDLGVAGSTDACAELNIVPPPLPRLHNSHKGTFGDVAIVGGDKGMIGAAILAASAALHAGAGRVYAASLGYTGSPFDPMQPELMLRDVRTLDVANQSVVAGCGGGTAIGAHLEHLIEHAKQLVLDADALNTIAVSPGLQTMIRNRPIDSTVMTPHPLEAARLLGVNTSDIQANRLISAQRIADQFQCTVVLKGSGTIIAAPHQLTRINPTGNARLASAGTGDVLAGMIGANLATGEKAFRAACQAVFRHGQIADQWPANRAFTAGSLITAL